MAIRMIGLDLDGTLLNGKKELTAHTRAVLEEAAERGVYVVPSTGRPRIGLPEEVLSISGVRYAVVTNGAAVCDLKTDRRIYTDCMSVADAADILRNTRHFMAVQGVFIGDWGYMEPLDYQRLPGLPFVDKMKRYIAESRKEVPDLPAYVEQRGEDPEKVVLMFLHAPGDPLPDLTEVRKIIDRYGEVAYVSGGVSNLEITHRTAGKGNALLELGRQLGIAREEIMAVGDSENDLDMIEKAGLGVAMANSEQLLLRAADAVTLSNDEDGVAAAVEKYVLGR